MIQQVMAATELVVGAVLTVVVTFKRRRSKMSAGCGAAIIIFLLEEEDDDDVLLLSSRKRRNPTSFLYKNRTEEGRYLALISENIERKFKTRSNGNKQATQEEDQEKEAQEEEEEEEVINPQPAKFETTSPISHLRAAELRIHHFLQSIDFLKFLDSQDPV
ncbi:hypothetical protein FQA39_LY06659 [Lamprigera yunnana]|nr:hypothetical protein FQA39_LY06659 [Lamprigera yunnana]